MKWILASGSPRRKEILGELLPQFDILPSLADENVVGLSPKDLVLELSKRKALEVARRPETEGAVVIGSDTVVALEEEILGKPKTGEEAFRMLSALSGRSHEVYTGVCFARRRGQDVEVRVQADRTKVFFNALSPDWIWEYIRGGSPMDKAGGYGIQDGGLVQKIEGSYTNVVGFPKELVEKMLQRAKEEWHD